MPAVLVGFNVEPVVVVLLEFTNQGWEIRCGNVLFFTVYVYVCICVGCVFVSICQTHSNSMICS